MSDRERIVVGVLPGQPEDVVRQAAALALRFDAELLCAFVDVGRYYVDDLGDGSLTLPFDPDLPELAEESFDLELKVHITRVLENSTVRWSIRALAGDPARALGALAESVGAAIIVVGTRDTTLRARLLEFFNGSVAAQLAHRQHRPVVVIPHAPVPFGDPLPWQTEDLA